jgi:serine/threonine protein kinase
MSTTEQVSELLLQWEELRDEGKNVPVEELCRDQPELTELVRGRIQALEAVYRVPNGLAPMAETQAEVPGRALFLEPGAISGYEILEVLGHGGMGVVYRARQLALKREVALKMILTGPHASAADVRRFRAEAEMVARLQHPNIVQIHEIGEHEGRPFLALELVEGGSLAEKVDGKPLPTRQAALLIETLARAVHYAHQRGIVHRDLKPANILLQNADCRLQIEKLDGAPPERSASGNLQSAIPKITDFGLAKRLDEAGQTQTGAVLGTPSYMAPEQASGRTHDIGPATDVYALGAILYELLTGRPPFQGATPLETVLQISSHDPPSPRTLAPRLDRDLETICLKCLEKEPCRRYASAADLADDLHRYLVGEAIHARSVTLVDRVARTLNRDDQLGRQFHALGTRLIYLAGVPLLTHVLAFAFWRGTASYPLAAILTTMISILGLLAIMLASAYYRGVLDFGAGSRLFWSIRLGHLLGVLLVPILYWQVASADGRTNMLGVYPMWAVVTGVTFFPLGSNFWGRLYLFGLAAFATAPLMALHLEWAPVELGLLVTITLGVVGLHLRKLDDEYRKAKEGR